MRWRRLMVGLVSMVLLSLPTSAPIDRSIEQRLLASSRAREVGRRTP